MAVKLNERGFAMGLTQCQHCAARLAFDQMPNGIARRGGKLNGDQDPDNNITIAQSPTEAALMRLFQFLNDRLDPNDRGTAEQLITGLFEAWASDDGNNNNGTGGKAAPSTARAATTPMTVAQDASYRARFPNEGRLRQSAPTTRRTADDGSYEKMFPNHNRLVKRFA